MSRKTYQPVTLIDTYSLGFRFPWPSSQGPLLRNGTIVAVCWDGDEAQFVNAANLAVPCRPGDLLRRQLTRASHREYGAIIGDGQFAMKPPVLKAKESAGTLCKWVLYHFELGEFCLFFDDDAAWEAFAQRMCADIAKDYQRQIDSLLEYQQAHAAWMKTPRTDGIERLEKERQQAIANELQHLTEQRRQALEQDRQLGAWLRGELPAPPLLRSVA